MTSIRKRLLVAALLSSSGFLATTSYYRATAPRVQTKAEIFPIAFVKNVDGSHQQKRASSALWANLQEGDPLFIGDTLKTGDQGSLRVQFARSTQALELDSDTTLILTQAGQAIVIDLKDGYVKSQGSPEATPELRVLTEDGKTQVIAKDTVITKDKTTPVQVNLSSKAPVNPLNIVWREPNDDLATDLNPEDPVPQSFAWSGAREAQTIAIEWGPTRKKMEHRRVFGGSQEKAAFVLPIGRHYWRWSVLENEKTVYTAPTRQILVKGIYPPAVTSPSQAQHLFLKELGETVEFKWAPDKRFDKYKIEVASDRAFGTPLVNEESTESSYAFKPKALGDVFWRISGRLPPTGKTGERWLKTKTYSFKTAIKEKVRVKLTWLTRGGPTEFLTPKPSVQLSWDADNKKSIKTYRLRVASSVEDLAQAVPVVSPLSKLESPLDEIGPHVAQVEALNSELDVIGVSPVLSFDAQPVPLLRAPAFATQDDELNANARGQITLTWQSVDGAKDYVVELKDASGKALTRRTNQSTYTFSRLLPGRYELRISAVDEFGRTGHVNASKTVNVANKSALGAIKIKKVEVR